MRRTVSWTLLAIYLNASAQLLLPWVSDCFAHLFFWHEHFEHVHLGHVHSHHVATEMAAVAEDGRHEDSSSPPHPAFNPGKNVLSAHFRPVLALIKVRRREAAVQPSGKGFLPVPSACGEVPCPPPNLL